MGTGEKTAVYCGQCQTVFEAEERELFLDQIYCPCCTHRTEESNRADSVGALLRRHPGATFYEG